MYSGYTVQDRVESKQGSENIHIISPLHISVQKASSGMVVHRDHTGGLDDGKCIYLEDLEVDRHTEKNDIL
jgi:hypothetical protein